MDLNDSWEQFSEIWKLCINLIKKHKYKHEISTKKEQKSVRLVGNFPFPEHFLGGCHRAYVTQTYGSKGQSEPMEDSRSGLSEQRYCCTTSICDHNQQPTYTTPHRSLCRLLYVVTSNRWSTRIHCLLPIPNTTTARCDHFTACGHIDHGLLQI